MLAVRKIVKVEAVTKEEGGKGANKKNGQRASFTGGRRGLGNNKLLSSSSLSIITSSPMGWLGRRSDWIRGFTRGQRAAWSDACQGER